MRKFKIRDDAVLIFLLLLSSRIQPLNGQQMAAHAPMVRARMAIANSHDRRIRRNTRGYQRQLRSDPKPQKLFHNGGDESEEKGRTARIRGVGSARGMGGDKGNKQEGTVPVEHIAAYERQQAGSSRDPSAVYAREEDNFKLKSSAKEDREKLNADEGSMDFQGEDPVSPYVREENSRKGDTYMKESNPRNDKETINKQETSETQEDGKVATAQLSGVNEEPPTEYNHQDESFQMSIVSNGTDVSRKKGGFLAGFWNKVAVGAAGAAGVLAGIGGTVAVLCADGETQVGNICNTDNDDMTDDDMSDDGLQPGRIQAVPIKNRIVLVLPNGPPDDIKIIDSEGENNNDLRSQIQAFYTIRLAKAFGANASTIPPTQTGLGRKYKFGPHQPEVEVTVMPTPIAFLNFTITAFDWSFTDLSGNQDGGRSGGADTQGNTNECRQEIEIGGSGYYQEYFNTFFDPEVLDITVQTSNETELRNDFIRKAGGDNSVYQNSTVVAVVSRTNERSIIIEAELIMDDFDSVEALTEQEWSKLVSLLDDFYNEEFVIDPNFNRGYISYMTEAEYASYSFNAEDGTHIFGFTANFTFSDLPRISTQQIQDNMADIIYAAFIDDYLQNPNVNDLPSGNKLENIASIKFSIPTSAPSFAPSAVASAPVAVSSAPSTVVATSAPSVDAGSQTPTSANSGTAAPSTITATPAPSDPAGSQAPSSYPSNVPTTEAMNMNPSDVPSTVPSVIPSETPSEIPSTVPSSFPSSFVIAGIATVVLDKKTSPGEGDPGQLTSGKPPSMVPSSTNYDIEAKNIFNKGMHYYKAPTQSSPPSSEYFQNSEDGGVFYDFGTGPDHQFGSSTKNYNALFSISEDEHAATLEPTLFNMDPSFPPTSIPSEVPTTKLSPDPSSMPTEKPTGAPTVAGSEEDFDFETGPDYKAQFTEEVPSREREYDELEFGTGPNFGPESVPGPESFDYPQWSSHDVAPDAKDDSND